MKYITHYILLAVIFIQFTIYVKLLAFAELELRHMQKQYYEIIKEYQKQIIKSELIQDEN